MSLWSWVLPLAVATEPAAPPPADAPEVRVGAATAPTRALGFAQVGVVVDPLAPSVGVGGPTLALGVDAALGDRARLVGTARMASGAAVSPFELIDRAYVDVALDDHVHLRVGKQYSPYGYWNATTPYGDWNSPTPDRPLVLAFEEEGASIATRQGAIDVVGEHPLGRWWLGYHVGAGNGRSSDLRATDVLPGDRFGGAAWTQLWARSPGGVGFGATGAVDHVPAAATAGPGRVRKDVTEVLANAHLELLRPRTELLAEVFLVGHTAEGAPIVWNQGGYVQAARRFGRTTPYLRADYAERWATDPLYTDLGDRGATLAGLLGVRQDLTPNLRARAQVSAGRAVTYTTGPTTAADHLTVGVFLDAGL